MAWKVEYTDKRGARVLSPAFGSDTVAASYARTVKLGKLVPCAVEAPSVDVRKVPDGAIVDAQRAREVEALLSERAAEASFEAGSQARLYGASTSDALDDARDAADHVYREAEPVKTACAMGCGRTVKLGFTTCRTCSKGL